MKPEGRAIYTESSRIWRQRQDHLLAALSPIERVALDTILDKLLAFDDWDSPVEALSKKEDALNSSS